MRYKNRYSKDKCTIVRNLDTKYLGTRGKTGVYDTDGILITFLEPNWADDQIHKLLDIAFKAYEDGLEAMCQEPELMLEKWHGIFVDHQEAKKRA